jgi:TonB family protein
MKMMFWILLWILSLPALAQDSTVYFYDEEGEKTIDPAAAFSYRIVIKAGEHLDIRDYFASNDQLLLEGRFLSAGRTMIKDGPYKSFYGNGKPQVEGTYVKDRKAGLWKTYYFHGQQEDQLFYWPDKIMYHQHWDHAGNPLLTNGTGKFTVGHEHFEVIDSLVFSAFKIDSLTADSIYTAVEENAEYDKGMDAFYDDVEKDLKYPKLARQYLVSGHVLVEFVVDKSGKLTRAKVRTGIGGGCDEAALDAVKKRTKWFPATVKGKPVNQMMAVPIAFNIK